MIKWFAYIVMLLIFAPCSSSANIKNDYFRLISGKANIFLSDREISVDTTKNNKKPAQDDKGKIKEVTKAKKQPKPEKIEPENSPGTSKTKQRPKRQRRPEGLERPPEIPRRNGS